MQDALPAQIGQSAESEGWPVAAQELWAAMELISEGVVLRDDQVRLLFANRGERVVLPLGELVEMSAATVPGLFD